MTCEGCAKPSGGIYIAGCLACSVRSLCRSPLYHASQQAGKLTPAYQRALGYLGDVGEVDQLVREAAARDRVTV